MGQTSLRQVVTPYNQRPLWSEKASPFRWSYPFTINRRGALKREKLQPKVVAIIIINGVV